MTPYELSLAQTAYENEQKAQEFCTHKQQFGGWATIKHQMIAGDIWERCMRCGRTWKNSDGPTSGNYGCYQPGTPKKLVPKNQSLKIYTGRKFRS
jgi:hypothetical protein